MNHFETVESNHFWGLYDIDPPAPWMGSKSGRTTVCISTNEASDDVS